MSSPSEPDKGRLTGQAGVILELSTTNPAVEIQVEGANLDRVARGFGHVRQVLPPGIYQATFRSGSVIEQELIALREGHDHIAPPRDLAVATVAPVSGPIPESEKLAFRDAERRAAPWLASDRTLGELIVIVRAISDQVIADAPLQSELSLWAHCPGATRHAEDDLEHVGNTTEAHAKSFRVLRARVSAGGYVLRRTFAPAAMPTEQAPMRGHVAPRTTDQALWVAEGMQTVVFIPRRREGIAPELASIHMAPVDDPWRPTNPIDREAATVLESVLEMMRVGKEAVSEQMIEFLVGDKARNPMLGIVAAHSLLLDRTPDWALFDQVLSFLDRRIRGHPDVVALHALRVLRAAPTSYYGTSAVGAVTFPPMLLSSYRALLEYDAEFPERDTIGHNSLAERAAAQLLIGSVWTSWLSMATPVVRSVGETHSALHSGPGTGALRGVPKSTKSFEGLATVLGASSVLARATDALVTTLLKFARQGVAAREWAHDQHRLSTDDPAERRLRLTLNELARETSAKSSAEFIHSLEPRSLARATGLPMGVVQNALDALRKSTPNEQP